MITARVSTHLILRESDLTPAMAREIGSHLIVANPERIQAIRQKLWGAHNLPETINMIERHNGLVKLPRGYAAGLKAVCAAHGVELTWDQQRAEAPIDTSSWRIPTLRPHQGPAVAALLRHEQGIYQAPAGSGKTVTTLEVIRYARQKACIIVDKTNIARQWQERAEQFLGITPEIWGDGTYGETGDVTIAMQQSLWSRYDELQRSGWFDQFGLVVIDEMHHVSAQTYKVAFQAFPARYRFGVSATPDREQGFFPVVKAIIGPIVHETKRESLREAGILVSPEVVRVPTPFAMSFWGNIDVKMGQPCPVPDCKKDGTRHSHRTNFAKVEGALAKDQERAELVAHWVSRHREHCNLVVSRRVGHLYLIAEKLVEEYGWDYEDVLILTGQQSTDERMAIGERAERASCVILSTIAEEALDIPRIDRLYLAWPTKNTAITVQRVGRVERAHPEKRDAVVFDFVDDMGIFVNQFGTRNRSVYGPAGYTVTLDADQYAMRLDVA